MSKVCINDEMNKALRYVRKLGETVNNVKYDENKIVRPEFPTAYLIQQERKNGFQ